MSKSCSTDFNIYSTFFYNSTQVSTILVFPINLPNNDGVRVREVVRWNLQVQRSGSQSDSSGSVVMRSVAGTVESTEVTGIVDGHTSQMGAHTESDEETVVLHTVFVAFLMAEVANVHSSDLLDFFRTTMTDKERFTTPFKGDTFTLRNRLQVHFCLGNSQNVSTSTHCVQQIRHESFSSISTDDSHTTDHEVGERTSWNLRLLTQRGRRFRGIPTVSVEVRKRNIRVSEPLGDKLERTGGPERSTYFV